MELLLLQGNKLVTLFYSKDKIGLILELYLQYQV